MTDKQPSTKCEGNAEGVCYRRASCGKGDRRCEVRATCDAPHPAGGAPCARRDNLHTSRRAKLPRRDGLPPDPTSALTRSCVTRLTARRFLQLENLGPRKFPWRVTTRCRILMSSSTSPDGTRTTWVPRNGRDRQNRSERQPAPEIHTGSELKKSSNNGRSRTISAVTQITVPEYFKSNRSQFESPRRWVRCHSR
jgi:hypothetical protein